MDYKRQLLIWDITYIKEEDEFVRVNLRTNKGTYSTGICKDCLYDSIHEKID